MSQFDGKIIIYHCVSSTLLKWKNNKVLNYLLLFFILIIYYLIILLFHTKISEQKVFNFFRTKQGQETKRVVLKSNKFKNENKKANWFYDC